MTPEGRDGQNQTVVSKWTGLVYRMQNGPGLDGHLGLAGFHATSNCALENTTNDRLMDAVHKIPMSFSIFFFVSLCYRTERQ